MVGFSRAHAGATAGKNTGEKIKAVRSSHSILCNTNNESDFFTLVFFFLSNFVILLYLFGTVCAELLW